jgi:hypothetical protein
MSITSKLVKNKVILDLSVSAADFCGTPQYRELDLHKDGEWFCSYMGFIDFRQMEELRAAYEVKEKALDSPLFVEINETLQKAHSTRELDELLRRLRAA